MFPLHFERVADVDEAITVARGQDRYFSVLSRSGITVRDAITPDWRIVSSHERDEESIGKHGYNHWMEWMNSQCLVFGTCSGVCFIVQVSEKGEIGTVRFVEVGLILTGTFHCHGAVGICAVDSRLIFIDENGNVTSSHQLEFGGTGMKSSKCYTRAMLSGIVATRPCLIQIPTAAIHKPKKLKPMFFDVEDTGMISFCSQKSILAVAKTDGSVECIRSKPVQVVKRDDGEDVNEVIFMEWICDEEFLCIIKRSGAVYVYDHATRAMSTTKIPELCSAQSLFYDYTTRCLVFTDGKSLNRLEFASVTSDCAFTCSRVFDYATNKCLCLCGNDVFPYQNVLKSDRGWLLQAPDCVVSKCGGNPVIKRIATQHIAFYGDFVFLFVEDDGHSSFLVCDWNLEELARREITHSMHNVTQNRNHLVVSCHTRCTDLSFGNEPTTSHPDELVSQKLYMKSIEFSSGRQIQAAVHLEDVGVVAFGWDSSLIGLENHKLRESDIVRVTWSTRDPEVFVIQKPEQIILLYKQIMIRCPDLVCHVTDGCHSFRLKEEIQFGKIEFEAMCFAPFLILSRKLQDYDELVSFYKDMNINSILATCIRLTSYKDQIENLLTLMEKIFKSRSPEDVAKIIEAMIPDIEECERVVFFGVPFQWSYFFSHLKDETKLYFFLFASPRLFETMRDEEFAKQFFTPTNSLWFVDSSIRNGRIVRAVQLAIEYGIDVTSRIKSKRPEILQSLDKCIQSIEREVNRWNVWDGFAPRSMATFLSSADASIISLATFIILQEQPKVQALLMVDEKLRAYAQEFISTAVLSRHTQFVKACLK